MRAAQYFSWVWPQRLDETTSGTRTNDKIRGKTSENGSQGHEACVKGRGEVVEHRGYAKTDLIPTAMNINSAYTQLLVNGACIPSSPGQSGLPDDDCHC